MNPRRLAVFSRNHRQWLEGATQIARRDQNKQVVFRARSRWATAQRAIDRDGGAIPIYFASVGSPGLVDYTAELVGVLLDPILSPLQARDWLERTLEGTKDEELWDPPARTLYAIRDCRKLKRPFSFTDLVKASDRKNISADYGYSYAVVQALPQPPQ